MTGLELLAFFGSVFALGVGALATAVHLGERKKHAFVARAAGVLGPRAPLRDVESGDVERPLSFSLGATRVRAVVRGRVELWQLEHLDDAIAVATLAVVQRGWHAPDVRQLSPVTSLTPRLQVYAADSAAAHELLAGARAELCAVLGRSTRRCILGQGRVFLEVARHGLTLEELRDGICRMRGLLAVVAGEEPDAIPDPSAEALPGGHAGTRSGAVAGPGGALIPGLRGCQQVCGP